MQAVKKYDPWKGVKLSSYAAWWIRAYIIRFIMENWRMVKLGTTQAQRKLFFNLGKERDKLLARGHRPHPAPARQEPPGGGVRGRGDGRPHGVRRPLARRARVPRRRRLAADAGSTACPTAAAAPTSASGTSSSRRLFRSKLDAFAGTITDEKERFIFEHRLLPPEGDAPLTLQEVGDRFKLTRERARQIEAKLTARLRDLLKAEIPDFELLGPPD